VSLDSLVFTAVSFLPIKDASSLELVADSLDGKLD
jgi:hypothetical protein